MNKTPVSQLWRSAPNFLSDYPAASDSWPRLADWLLDCERKNGEIPALVRAELLLLRFDLEKGESAWREINPEIIQWRKLGLSSALGLARENNPDLFKIIDRAQGHLEYTLYLLDCYQKGEIGPWRKLW